MLTAAEIRAKYQTAATADLKVPEGCVIPGSELTNVTLFMFSDMVVARKMPTPQDLIQYARLVERQTIVRMQQGAEPAPKGGGTAKPIELTDEQCEQAAKLLNAVETLADAILSK